MAQENPLSALSDFVRPPQLLKIEYDEFKQRNTVRDVIAGGLSIFQSHKDSAVSAFDNFGIGLVAEMSTALIYPVLTFKAKVWRNEKEWRLVFPKKYDDRDVKYRDGRSGLTPYVVFYPGEHTGFHGKWPITNIVLGPAPSLHHSAFRRYFDLQGILHRAKLTTSEMALRF